MSMGALNVAFSDSSEPYAQRGWRMLRASIMVAIAVFAGAVSGGNLTASVAVATACAFAAGMLVALGQAAADIGALSLVVLVVFAAQPMPGCWLSPEGCCRLCWPLCCGPSAGTIPNGAYWPTFTWNWRAPLPRRWRRPTRLRLARKA